MEYKIVRWLTSPLFTSFAGVATVISFTALFFTDKTRATIALCVFCLFLLTLLLIIAHALHSFLTQRHPDEYAKKCTFIKYETYDGSNILYEVFRFIQAKRPIITEIKHGFSWSGTSEPDISSEIQLSDGKIVKGCNGDYDHTMLKLKKPLLYNDTCVLHFQAKRNDCDKKSDTMVVTKMESPCEMLHHRISLLYKPNDYNKTAQLSRRKISSQKPCEYELIAEIPFTPQNRCYEHYMPWPEAGYFYKIAWER